MGHLNDRITVNINRAMKYGRVSQRRLSSLTGIARGTLSHKLLGAPPWDTDDLEKIAPALQMTIQELVTDPPDEPTYLRRLADQIEATATVVTTVTMLALLPAVLSLIGERAKRVEPVPLIGERAKRVEPIPGRSP